MLTATLLSTFCSKCDQASDLWKQLELASELESHLRGTVDCNAGKTQLVSFDWSNDTGAIYVVIDGCVLEEKSSFKMLGLTGTLGSLSKYSQLMSFL